MGQVGPFFLVYSAFCIKSTFLQSLGVILLFQLKFLSVLRNFNAVPDFGGVQASWTGPPKSSILVIFTKTALFDVI